MVEAASKFLERAAPFTTQAAAAAFAKNVGAVITKYVSEYHDTQRRVLKIDSMESKCHLMDSEPNPNSRDNGRYTLLRLSLAYDPISGEVSIPNVVKRGERRDASYQDDVKQFNMCGASTVPGFEEE